MDEATLKQLGGELGKLLDEFEPCFRSKPSREHMSTYVRGQLGPLKRKSVEPIALDAGVLPRTLQKFLGAYRWDEAAMRSKVREIVARDHPDPNAIGVIDETSFDKKGMHTAGIQRQWCGHTGKIDNCVKTVHLTYVAREFATIVDSDLYVPKVWADDRERRAEAGIPESMTFRTQWEIALDLLRRSVRDGPLRLTWLTADEFYGRVSAFLDGVAGMGITYVVEVPVNTMGWTPRAYARGTEHRRVDDLFRRGGPSWVDYHVKDTTKGPVVWRVRATRFVSHAGSNRSEKWLLIAVNVLTNETKYFLSNAPETTEVSTLLTVAFRRWQVEHNFKESKQEVGFDHYEVRTYRSMQRHLALSMVSLLFLVRSSQLMKKQTAANWTVPQTRSLVNVLVDQTLTPVGRERQLEKVLYKAAYYQRRGKVAEESHRRRRKQDLRDAGIDLRCLRHCPKWPGDGGSAPKSNCRSVVPR